MGTLQLEPQRSGMVRVTEGLQLLGPGESLGVPPALLHECLLCSLPGDRAGKRVPAVAEPCSFAELRSQTTCGGSSVVLGTTKHLQVCSPRAAVGTELEHQVWDTQQKPPVSLWRLQERAVLHEKEQGTPTDASPGHGSAASRAKTFYSGVGSVWDRDCNPALSHAVAQLDVMGLQERCLRGRAPCCR